MLSSIPRSLTGGLRLLWRHRPGARARGKTAPPSPRIAATVQIHGRDNVQLAPTATLKDYVVIHAPEKPIVIGEHSHVNHFSVIMGGDGVYIGDRVMIAPHCILAAGNHNYLQLEQSMLEAEAISKGPIRIGDGVWVGANCTITDGVTIGREAVIGANSVVTRDVGEYEIWAGVPAKKIGDRRNLVRKISQPQPAAAA